MFNFLLWWPFALCFICHNLIWFCWACFHFQESISDKHLNKTLNLCKQRVKQVKLKNFDPSENISGYFLLLLQKLGVVSENVVIVPAQNQWDLNFTFSSKSKFQTAYSATQVFRNLNSESRYSWKEMSLILFELLFNESAQLNTCFYFLICGCYTPTCFLWMH